EVDVVASLVLLLRDAELAVDRDHGVLVPGELSRGLGHRSPLEERQGPARNHADDLHWYRGGRVRSIRRLRGNGYGGQLGPCERADPSRDEADRRRSSRGECGSVLPCPPLSASGVRTIVEPPVRVQVEGDGREQVVRSLGVLSLFGLLSVIAQLAKASIQEAGPELLRDDRRRGRARDVDLAARVPTRPDDGIRREFGLVDRGQRLGAEWQVAGGRIAMLTGAVRE